MTKMMAEKSTVLVFLQFNIYLHIFFSTHREDMSHIRDSLNAVSTRHQQLFGEPFHPGKYYETLYLTISNNIPWCFFILANGFSHYQINACQ